MKYQPNQIYHVFNQGNNKQLIYFNPENYNFFLRKVEKYVLPNAEVLAYCLMPNHFHFLLWMKEEGCLNSNASIPGYKRTTNLYQERFIPNFSKDLSTLLRSYTRAINHQNSRTGSLFRAKTKCKQASNDKLIQNLNQSTIIAIDYEKTCFNYIHQNPVKAGLVRNEIDWEFSSARAYANRGLKSICNIELSKELGLIL